MAHNDGSMRPPGTMSLTGDLAIGWVRWIERWQFYMLATEKTQKPGPVQVAMLLTLMGPEAIYIYRTFEWANPLDKDDIELVKGKFAAYFAPRRNVTYERYKFMKRVQKVGVPFDTFATDLRNLIQTCEYHVEERENLLRDQIVLGISSDSVREKLFYADGGEAKLTLPIAVDICKNSEMTVHLMQNVSVDASVHVPVHAMKSSVKSSKQKVKPKYSGDRATTKQGQGKCKYCGQSHKARSCPAWGRNCNICGRKNHFACVCTQNKPVDALQTGVIDDVTVAEVKSNEWFETVGVDGRDVKVKVDTGASCNVMSMNTYQALASDKLVKSKTRLESYGGHKLSVVGKWCCVAEYDNKLYPLDFIVVKEMANTLLGLHSCVDLGIVKQASEVTDRDQLIVTYSDVFNGLGLLPGEHTIRLKDDVTPVVYSARKVPHRLRDQLKAELDKMVEDGIIEAVTVQTEWVSPLVLVMKTGGKIRICLDPSSLNEAIKRELFKAANIMRYPPQMKYLLAYMDPHISLPWTQATSGFLQMKLDEESSYKTTFAIPYGRYRYLRLPFGIKSAPEVYHRTVADLFSDIEGVETYIDDFIIHGSTEEQHDQRLRQVLDRCRKVNLKLNLSKCEFKKTELQYLGNVISRNTIRPDRSKTDAMCDMPEPQNKGDVRRILGMVTYLAKFCPNLSTVAAPLRDLTRKEVAWTWDAIHKEALRQVKDLVSSPAMLTLYDPHSEITLSVDASQYGLGACIMQYGVSHLSHLFRRFLGSRVDVLNHDEPALSICSTLWAYVVFFHILFYSVHPSQFRSAPGSGSWNLSRQDILCYIVFFSPLNMT